MRQQPLFSSLSKHSGSSFRLTDYQTTDDAEYDSWMLLEAVGPAVEDEPLEAGGAEPEGSAEEGVAEAMEVAL